MTTTAAHHHSRIRDTPEWLTFVLVRCSECSFIATQFFSKIKIYTYSVPGSSSFMFWVWGDDKIRIFWVYTRDATHGGASLWKKTGGAILSLANHYPTCCWQYWFYCTRARDQQETRSFYVTWCWEAVGAWRECRAMRRMEIRMFLKAFLAGLISVD